MAIVADIAPYDLPQIVQNIEEGSRECNWATGLMELTFQKSIDSLHTYVTRSILLTLYISPIFEMRKLRLKKAK